MTGLHYMPMVALGILALLATLYMSYRQTAAAYPDGGGAYIVAKDYVLNVAVGISAGVGAVVSAIPALHHHRLPFCLLVLVTLTFVNLRGVRKPWITRVFW
jgi:amino acid permease